MFLLTEYVKGLRNEMDINRRNFIKLSLGAVGMALVVPKELINSVIGDSPVKPVIFNSADGLKKYPGGYSLVIFDHKKNYLDPDEISLHLNGNMFIVARGEYIIMPNAVLNIVNETKWARPTTGGDKIERLIYPYKKIKDVSYTDYKRFMANAG